jgi:hypothetical protein
MLCSAVFSPLNVAQLPCTTQLPTFSSEKSQFTPCIAVFFRAENINFFYYEPVLLYSWHERNAVSPVYVFLLLLPFQKSISFSDYVEVQIHWNISQEWFQCKWTVWRTSQIGNISSTISSTFGGIWAQEVQKEVLHLVKTNMTAMTIGKNSIFQWLFIKS